MCITYYTYIISCDKHNVKNKNRKFDSIEDPDLPEKTNHNVSEGIEVLTKDALTRNASFAKAHPDELNAALRECEKAQALSPGLAEAYLYMALIFDEREEYDKALKNYRLYMKLYSSGDSKNDFEYARKRVQEIKRQGGK